MGNDDLGEINIQNFQSIIDKYEVLIKDLTSELDSFKLEQHSLKIRINDLLDENKELSNKLKNVDSNENPDSDVLNLITSLKEQLNFANNEKESIKSLWQNSLQTIDHLEGELKFYESSCDGLIPRNEVSKLKHQYETKFQALEKELVKTRLCFEEKLTTKSMELEKKNAELLKAVDTQSNTFKIVNNLEEEILKLQERLQNGDEARELMEKALYENNEKIELLKADNIDCRVKVGEAIQVVEAALNEKDAALLREKQAKEEVEKLSSTLAELIEEAGQKIKDEVESVKKEYNVKLRELLLELKNAQNEVKTKDLEVEKYVKECADLQKEIEKLQRFSVTTEENTTKLITLEKTLESTFQKLLLSEKQNVQLISEKESLKSDLEQMGNHYERDIKAREVEKLTLQNKIKSLQNELEDTHSKFTTMATKMEALNQQIMITEKEFKEQIAIKENMIRNFHKNAEAATNTSLTELKQHLEAQRSMNKKWRISTRAIIDKLQQYIEGTRGTLVEVKRENTCLREKLNIANNKVRDYKKMLGIIATDINKITDTVIGDGAFVKKSPKESNFCL